MCANILPGRCSSCCHARLLVAEWKTKGGRERESRRVRARNNGWGGVDDDGTARPLQDRILSQSRGLWRTLTQLVWLPVACHRAMTASSARAEE